jgi:hypothetical protein
MASASNTYAGVKVLTIGGSRNIGYFSSLRLLGPSPYIISVASSSYSAIHSLFLPFQHTNPSAPTEQGAIVTFLLRSGPAAFEKDKTIKKYVESGQARLFKGDALNKEDVSKAWEEAAKGEGWTRVNILLFTVGA